MAGFMADPPDVVVAALWNLPAGLNTVLPAPNHSGLMLANLMTFAHFSVSAAMKAAKPSGEPGNGVAPRSASLALILGSASAALTSRLSRSTMSCGVLRGAQRPHQPAAS